MMKARVFRLFGIALALGGLAVAAYFTAWMLGHRMAPLPVVLPQAWLPVPAMLGALVTLAGLAVARRQGRILRIEKARAQDRRRRVQQYRDDEARQARYAERLEPFLGPEAPQAEEARRRVA